MKKNLVYIGNHLHSSNKNPTYSLNLISRLTAAGFHVVETSSKSNKLLRYIDMWTTLIKHRKNCDFVLIDTYSTWNYYFAITLAWWARRFKLKYIPILHGGNLPRRLKTNPKQIKRYCAKAYCTVSPSAYLAEEFKKAGIENIEIVPNALDIEKFQFSSGQSQTARLIWLRSFIPIYNPQLAIRAFKLVKEEFSHAELTMAGPGEESLLNQCKELAVSLDLEIDFKGKLDQQEWIALAKEHDIFVNSSNFDNMPLSVIEAMAMGLAVVSTDVGGIPHLINDEHDGLLATAHDAESLAGAIAKLLTDTHLRAELIIKARSKVEAYNWEAVIEKWRTVLN